MFAKKAAKFYERIRLPQTLKNLLNFRVELKPLFVESFQGSRKQFHSKILIILRTNMYVTADLYQARQPDKPRIIGRHKVNMLLIVREYALFVCIWSRHLKLYLRKWSLIQMSFKKHSLYNLNWSCFEHTATCMNITMLSCVTAKCHCKVIDKLVMGESFVFRPVRLNSRYFVFDSRFLFCAGIENRESSWESRLATDCQLTFERYCISIEQLSEWDIFNIGTLYQARKM